MCGVVDGGITPGLWGYEAGQSGVGDIFGWFVEHGVPPAYHEAAAAEGVSVHDAAHRAGRRAGGRRARAGRARLARRQPLGAGRPRAVRRRGRPDPGHPARGHLPGAAGGHRVRHAHDHRGVRRVRGAGQRARRGGRAAQQRAAHADLRRRHRPAAVDHRLRRRGPRSGRRSTRRSPRAPTPTSTPPPRPWVRGAAASTSRIRQRAAAYDELYAEYRTLHDYFGRGANDVMHRLKARRRAAPPRRGRDDVSWPRSTSPSAGCARRWPRLHGELTRNGLVAWTAGNVSGAGARRRTCMVIKPSGVSYDELTADVDGRLRPRRQRSSTASTPRPPTRRRTPTSTGTCPRSAAWCTPTPRTPPRGPPAASRSRACSHGRRRVRR